MDRQNNPVTTRPTNQIGRWLIWQTLWLTDIEHSKPFEQSKTQKQSETIEKMGAWCPVVLVI